MINKQPVSNKNTSQKPIFRSLSLSLFRYTLKNSEERIRKRFILVEITLKQLNTTTTPIKQEMKKKTSRKSAKNTHKKHTLYAKTNIEKQLNKRKMSKHTRFVH